MGLSLGQRRVLTKTENAIRVSDPRLASLMDKSGWLNRAEEMPPIEHLAARARQRRRWVPRSRLGSRGCERKSSDAS